MMTARLAYLDVADYLREQILAGKLKPGDRLPTEAELCLQYGVSRSTIREALRMLSAHRLITTSRGVGGGTQVVGLDHGDITEMLRDHITMLSRSDTSTVTELVDVRVLVEVHCARLAARNSNPERAAKLRSAIPNDPQSLPAAELRRQTHHFHDILVEVAGNRMLRIVSEPLFRVMQNRPQPEGLAEDFWEQCTSEHLTISDAVTAGDADAAAEAMRRHLENLRARGAWSFGLEDTAALGARPEAGAVTRAQQSVGRSHASGKPSRNGSGTP